MRVMTTSYSATYVEVRKAVLGRLIDLKTRVSLRNGSLLVLSQNWRHLIISMYIFQ
jgi:hypothetical protein